MLDVHPAPSLEDHQSEARRSGSNRLLKSLDHTLSQQRFAVIVKNRIVANQARAGAQVIDERLAALNDRDGLQGGDRLRGRNFDAGHGPILARPLNENRPAMFSPG